MGRAALPALDCRQTGHTGKHCPGGGSELTTSTRGVGSIRTLWLLQGSRLCQGPCRVVRVGIRGHSNPQRPTPSPSHLGSPYQGWWCAAGRAAPPGPRPAPRGLSSCLGVCVELVPWGWGTGACCGAAAPVPPLQRGWAQPAPGVTPACRSPRGWWSPDPFSSYLWGRRHGGAGAWCTAPGCSP